MMKIDARHRHANTVSDASTAHRHANTVSDTNTVSHFDMEYIAMTCQL